nr:MAG TPA: hypothetical protein [Bacteriophage sp.]
MVVWPYLFETVLEKIYAFRYTNFLTQCYCVGHPGCLSA